ncbi:hypothetical protein [Synechococcus sp.]
MINSEELDSHQIQGALVLVTATGESSHDENWLNENEAPATISD